MTPAPERPDLHTPAGRALLRSLRDDDGVIAPTSFVESAHAYVLAIERETAALGVHAMTLHHNGNDEWCSMCVERGKSLAAAPATDAGLVQKGLSDAALFIMALPAATCGEPIHIPSFEALAALDIVRAALSRQAEKETA